VFASYGLIVANISLAIKIKIKTYNSIGEKVSNEGAKQNENWVLKNGKQSTKSIGQSFR